jgi:hypothetical protein
MKAELLEKVPDAVKEYNQCKGKMSGWHPHMFLDIDENEPWVDYYSENTTKTYNPHIKRVSDFLSEESKHFGVSLADWKLAFENAFDYYMTA